MKFVFECSPRFLTRECSDWEEKFHIHSAHALFCFFCKHTKNDVFEHFLKIFCHVPTILQKLSDGHTNVSEHFPKIKLNFISHPGWDPNRECTSVKNCPSFYKSQVLHLSKESFCPLPRLCLFAWHVTWWMEWDWQVWRGCAGAAVRRPWRSWERHTNPLWLLWRLAY